MTAGSGTNLEIDGTKFLINGEYTYPNRIFGGHMVEGLLFNVRAVQATFDDENYPETTIYNTDVGARSFVYPDTGAWDADRNVEEFARALPEWRAMGLLAATLCFQGGRAAMHAWRMSPWFNRRHPCHNSGFAPDGSLKPAYKRRMARALDALDENGMVAIVGFFYTGQDHRLNDEAAVMRAVDEATEWLLETGHRNIIVEVANEVCDAHFLFDILKPKRVAELIARVTETTLDGRRLYASTSLTPGSTVNEAVTRVSDVVLPHGNGQTPDGHKRLVDSIRHMEAYRVRPQPIVFNEAGVDVECLDAAFESYASWGYYDHGRNNYRDGFQSPPVNWTINTPTKRAFFNRVMGITQGGPR